VNRNNLSIMLAATIVMPWPEKVWGAPDVAVDLSMTYASKYIWRGYDVWNDEGAVQPDLFFDFTTVSLYAGIWASLVTDDQCIDGFGDHCASWNERDYYLGHYGTLLDGKPLQIDYDISYTYFDFYRQSDSDTQELGLLVKHPKLIENVGVPYWGMYYGWPVSGVGHSKFFKLGLESTFNLAGQALNTVIETVWDDGAGGFGVGEGISHVKVGIGTPTTLGGIGFEPSIYYQWAINDDVPGALLEDEFWVELSFNYSF